MPRALVPIPLARGLDTTLDERLRGPENLSVLTNGYHAKGGAVSKRHGFTSLPNGVVGDSSLLPTNNFPAETGRPDNQGPVKGLFSDGDNLCIRGHRSLYAYDETTTTWRNHGPISPCTIASQEPIWHDQHSIYSSDTGVSGSYLGHIAASAQQKDTATDAAGIDYSIVFSCETKSRQAVLTNLIIDGPATGGTQDQPRSGVRIVGLGDRFKLFWQRPVRAGASALKIASYTPGGADPVVVTTIADLNVNQNGAKQFRRAYDACAIGSNAYALVYLRFGGVGGGSAIIKRYNADDAETATATLPLPAPDVFDMCAIHYDSDTGVVFIAIVAADLATIDHKRIDVFGLDAVTLATNWGPVAFDSTLSATSYVEGLGLCVDRRTTIARLMCVYSVNASAVTDSSGRDVATDSLRVDVTSSNTIGGALATKFGIFNCHASSKPWFERGQTYLAVNSDTEVDGFGGAAVVALTVANNTAAPYQTVAVAYNFGVTPGGNGGSSGKNNFAGQGSLNSVIESSAGSHLFRFAAQRIGYLIKDQPKRLACDLVELDFDAAPVSAVASRGSACIGGGAVHWHAGAITEEVGWYGPPVIPGTSETSSTDNGFISASLAGGLLTPGATYSYQAVIETYDELGNLLRSVPSPARKFQVGAGHNAIRVTARVDSLSSRRHATGATDTSGARRRFGVVFYRAATDGIFNRASPPLMAMQQNEGGAGTSLGFYFRFDDLGTVTGSPIYTQNGAEVEAAGPDGASIVSVSPERVWLAGFGKRDRVQYSKRFNPGSANENSIGPEFNDAFSFIIPRGKKCTGLAPLDDKQVIFTADEIYLLAGRGPDDGGRNSDFSGLQALSTDAGCIEPRSVVVLPAGVMYMSRAGFYVLGRDIQVSFIGAPVEDLTNDFPDITSAVLVPKESQVRFTARNAAGSASVIIVFDYQLGAWSRWDVKVASEVAINAIGACMHGDVYHVLDASGIVYREDSATWKDAGAVYVPLVVETSWLQAAQQSGWQRIRQAVALCAKRDPHDLKVSLYQDFETAASQTFTWTEATIALMADAAKREQVAMRVSRQKSTAFKLRIEDIASAGTVTGEGYTCAGFAVELAGKRGTVKTGTQQRN